MVFKKIYALILCCSSIIAQGQDINQNLQKYWYYKYRLENQFMVLSSTDEPGSNIPFVERHFGGGKDFLKVGDGTIFLSQYISVLATEYRLLKDYGQDQDASETLNKLYYALQAFERLDMAAELLWCGEQDYTHPNGFFVRDDIDDDETNPQHQFILYNHPELVSDNTGLPPIAYVESDFSYSINWNCPWPHTTPAEMSQDQCWHLLLSFAMVKELVDAPNTFMDGEGANVTLKLMAQKNAYRIVNYMQDHNWHIINPVTGYNVERGDNALLDCWGFSEAANLITDMQFGDLSDNWTATEKPLFNQSFLSFTKYETSALYTIIGDKSGDSFNTLDMLKQKYYNHNSFEHLILMYYILHKNDESGIQNSIVYLQNTIENLLNVAPTCGPVNFNDESWPGYVSSWSSDNRLINPENIGTGTAFTGYYNGLDYLLLHNLYWLSLVEPSPFTLFVHETFPRTDNTGSTSNPLTLNAFNIYADNIINPDGDIKYTANRVSLTTGFHAKAGCHFVAKSVTVPIYKKTSFTIPNCDVSSYVGSLKYRDTTINNPSSKDTLLSFSNTITNPYQGIEQSKEQSLQQGHINKDIVVVKQSNTFQNNEDLCQLYETVKIFPNPCNGDFFVTIFSSINAGVVSVQNMLGVTVFEKEIKSNDPIHINLGSFSRGVYTVIVRLQSKTYINKIILQ